MLYNYFTSRMLRRISDILPFPQPVRGSDKLTNFLYLTIENFGSDSFYRPPVSVDYNDTYIDLRVALWVRKSCWHGQCFSTGSDFPRGVFYYVLLRRLTTWRDEELPTLASPCKGRGERVASEAGPDNDTLLTRARVRQQVSHALS